MALPVLIYGPSGSGKSTSLKGFAHDELALVNVMNKPLPFKTKFDGAFASKDYEFIKSQLSKTKKNAIVIDDAGYLITDYFMTNQGANKGNNAFAMYSQMADDFYKLIDYIVYKVPGPGQIVYIIMHEDQNEFGKVKPKTIGKMLDEKVCLEGLFTIVLRSEFNDGKYVFRTHTDGMDVAKTPEDMFEQDTVNNNLKEVDAVIREYYGMPGLREMKGDK